MNIYISNLYCRGKFFFRCLKIISWMLCCSILSGCVAAVVAGAAGGLVVFDRRSLVMHERDARIFHIIHTAIVTDRRFDNSRIAVSSFNQAVLLVGQTPNASLRVLAEKIAQSTANVRRVNNEITIDAPLSLIQESKDTLITSQVRSKMLTQKGLESGSIRVITENSVVFLMGIVTEEQATVAANVARLVHDVRKVVKVFQYIH